MCPVHTLVAVVGLAVEMRGGGVSARLTALDGTGMLRGFRAVSGGDGLLGPARFT
jgi:hypothetical protein